MLSIVKKCLILLIVLTNKILRNLKIRKRIISVYPYTIFSSTQKHTFFGYYDKIPFSIDETKILAITVDCDNLPLDRKIQNKATLGYFNINSPKEFHPIGETETWCWQQGCRLMWFPGDDQVIYNTLVEENYGCVIQNILDKKIIKKLNFPIYDINKEGIFGLSLNFSRLHRLRPGYGYINFTDWRKDELSPENDGIWLCDLLKNTKKLIINLKKLSDYEPEYSMKNAEHYINHLCFNPEGDRFLFFHLWIKDGIRYNRCITSDISGANLKIINNKGFVSHYCWKNNNEILIFSSINNKTKYYLFQDNSKKVEIIGDGLLNHDGHPTFINDNQILTDTYPSRFLKEQSVIIYDINKNEVNNITKIYTPWQYIGEVRCDLHPRISRSGRYVCIDLPLSQGRKLGIFDIR